MTTKHFAIWDALTTRAESFDSLVAPGIELALPNQGAPTADRYLEVMTFGNQPAWQGITSGVLDQGLFQLVLTWPSHTSLNDAWRVVDEVMTHFAKGQELFSGGVKVKVNTEPFHGSPIIEPDKAMIQITIPWKA